MPYEGVLIAAIQLAGKLVELMALNRQTMAPETQERMDLVWLAGLERLERIMARIEALGQKGIQS